MSGDCFDPKPPLKINAGLCPQSICILFQNGPRGLVKNKQLDCQAVSLQSSPEMVFGNWQCRMMAWKGPWGSSGGQKDKWQAGRALGHEHGLMCNLWVDSMWYCN